MHTRPSLSQKAKTIRAAAVAAALVFLGAPVQNAVAGDALTTGVANAATSNAGRGILGGLFRKNQTDPNAYVAPKTPMQRVNNSILGLPLGILRSAGGLASRLANKTVSDHVKQL